MPAPVLKEAPVFRVRFRNSSKAALNLFIEPLGDRVAIPAGATVEVRCSEQLGHPNEFEMSDDGLTIYGWVQRVLVVAQDGELEELWALPEH